MSDFRARIEAFADLGKATSDIESFVNKARKLKVDDDLNQTGAGQILAGILSQLQGQARSSGNSAGAQFASAFSGSLGQINVSAATQSLNNFRDALSNKFKFDSGAVDNITKSLNDMDVSVQSVQAKMNAKGGLNVTVKGVDQLGRAVTTIKNFDAAGNQLS